MWVDCKRVNWVFWKLEDSYYVRMYVCTYGRKEGRKEGSFGSAGLEICFGICIVVAGLELLWSASVDEECVIAASDKDSLVWRLLEQPTTRSESIT